MRRVVVFPAPLGPRKPVTRPGWTVKSSPRTAATLPKFLTSPRTSIVSPRGEVVAVIGDTLPMMVFGTSLGSTDVWLDLDWFGSTAPRGPDAPTG